MQRVVCVWITIVGSVIVGKYMATRYFVYALNVYMIFTNILTYKYTHGYYTCCYWRPLITVIVVIVVSTCFFVFINSITTVKRTDGNYCLQNRIYVIYKKKILNSKHRRNHWKSWTFDLRLCVIHTCLIILTAGGVFTRGGAVKIL